MSEAQVVAKPEPKDAVKPKPKDAAHHAAKRAETEAKKDWKDLFRGTIVTMPATFGSAIIERQYHRQFLLVGRNAHFISKMGRILLSEDDAVEAENFLNKHVTKVIKNIQDSSGRLTKLAEAAGVKVVGEKNGAVSVQAPLTSPIQRRFLDLLQLADDELNLLHTLWIMGEVPEKDRTEREYQIKRHIRAVSLSSRNLYIGLRKRLVQSGTKLTDGDLEEAAADLEAADEPGDGTATGKPARAKKAKEPKRPAAAPAAAEVQPEAIAQAA